MSTLIVDIETVGEAWETFDAVTKEQLTRWLRYSAKDATEYENKLTDLKAGLGFSPLTGHIVALGVYDLERKQGTVYYQGESPSTDEVEEVFRYKVRSETELLREFWEGVQEYDTVVTFNGRMFDIPFLLHRSIACEIIPSVDLLRYRYLTQQVPPYHIDLAEQLTFYGAMGKRPSLHLFCRAYGIDSPKRHGVSGDTVAELFREKKFRDIAVYNAQDLLATASLYEKWRVYLAPTMFSNKFQADDSDII